MKVWLRRHPSSSRAARGVAPAPYGGAWASVAGRAMAGGYDGRSANHEAAFACIVLPGGRTIGGGASPAFAAGCSFSIRESETRDCVGDRRTKAYDGSKRASDGSKTKCGRLFCPLGRFSW